MLKENLIKLLLCHIVIFIIGCSVKPNVNKEEKTAKCQSEETEISGITKMDQTVF